MQLFCLLPWAIKVTYMQIRFKTFPMLYVKKGFSGFQSVPDTIKEQVFNGPIHHLLQGERALLTKFFLCFRAMTFIQEQQTVYILMGVTVNLSSLRGAPKCT